VFAPDAVREVVPPVHIDVLEAVVVTVGDGFTVTTTEPVVEHPVLVLVFVRTYVVVIVGDATVLAAFGFDKPALGDQL
jgi:hypothetical protein